MLLEIADSFFYASIISLTFIAAISALGLALKWKWYTYLMIFTSLILIFPASFIIVYKFYVYEQYNYHFSGAKSDEIQEHLAPKARIPMLIPGCTDIELSHSMQNWSVRCKAGIKEWNNAYGVWNEKFDLKKVDRYIMDTADTDLIKGIDLQGFTWDEKYETPVAANGARFSILRNSKNGECCLHANRW